MAYYPDNSSLTSKYNEAALQVLRLSSLWQRNHNNFFSGNYNGMVAALNRIWIELSADAKRKNPKYFKQMFDLHNKTQAALEKYKSEIRKQNEYLSSGNYNKKAAEDISEKVRQAHNNIFVAIQGMEIFLKDLQTEVGKGSAYKEDSSKMF